MDSYCIGDTTLATHMSHMQCNAMQCAAPVELSPQGRRRRERERDGQRTTSRDIKFKKATATRRREASLGMVAA